MGPPFGASVSSPALRGSQNHAPPSLRMVLRGSWNPAQSRDSVESARRFPRPASLLTVSGSDVAPGVPPPLPSALSPSSQAPHKASHRPPSRWFSNPPAPCLRAFALGVPSAWNPCLPGLLSPRPLQASAHAPLCREAFSARPLQRPACALVPSEALTRADGPGARVPSTCAEATAAPPASAQRLGPGSAVEEGEAAGWVQGSLGP